MKEVWKDCLDGFYQVANTGKVRRVKLWSGKLVERYPVVFLDACGYPRINVSLRGRHGNKRIHCLVAEAFIGPRPDGMEVNHKDLNRKNCQAVNLEYQTHADNIRYSFSAGRYDNSGVCNPRAILSESDVLKIRKLWACGRDMKSLAINFGVSHGTIWHVVNGLTWKNVA